MSKENFSLFQFTGTVCVTACTAILINPKKKIVTDLKWLNFFSGGMMPLGYNTTTEHQSSMNVLMFAHNV